MCVKVIVHGLGGCDLISVDRGDDIARLNAGLRQRRILSDRIDMGRLGAQCVGEAHHVADIDIRRKRGLVFLPVTGVGHRDRITFLKVVEGEPVRHVAADIDMAAHKLGDRIPGPEACLVGGRLLGNRDHLGRIVADRAHDDHRPDEGENEIKERPGKNDGDPLPDGCALEGALLRASCLEGIRIVLIEVVVHAFHFTGAAEEQRLEGVACSAPDRGENARSEAHGELHDIDA